MSISNVLAAISCLTAEEISAVDNFKLPREILEITHSHPRKMALRRYNLNKCSLEKNGTTWGSMYRNTGP